MNENDNKKWILAYNRELLGKVFFKNAIDLIVNEKDFSQACSYIKNGLDYVTCDCTIGGWRNMYRNLETPVFDDNEISELNDDNYYFCKAFVLSYEEDKESLNSALRAIIKYTYNNPDDYADYITGKIILNMGCPDAALLYFDKKAIYTKNKAIFDYRFGRTKEQNLIDYGLDDIYNSFLENYSSGCCLRVLKQYTRKHNINIEADKNLILENEIVHNFIYDFDESDLQDIYENTIGKDHLTESELPIIENFIQMLKSNKSLFLKPLDYERDISYYTHKFSYDNYPMDIMFENNMNENNDMEELINDIYEEVKDFRADENIPSVKMTKNRIRQWINQFDENDRVFILTELKNIVDKRYCTKQNAYDFLKGSLEALKKHFNYDNVSDFLLETVFLDLQRPNKSQPTLLKLFREVLQEQFNFNIDNCGSRQKKHYLYLDDVLCTGNTLFQDIKTWVNQNDSDGQTYLSKLQSGNLKLIFLYLFIHETNYHKKRAQFRHQISQNFDNFFTMFRAIELENGIGTKIEVVMPTEENQPENVKQYQQQVEEKVNTYCEQKSIAKPNPEFYRPSNQPTNEDFFTSSANRKRFEDILLQRGVRILNAASTNIPNLRALGYSLPSLKNFGFGTLAMTWRNIPNNCPIVFWYSGGGFFPLFVKHQT